jgi:hypothetical protein
VYVTCKQVHHATDNDNNNNNNNNNQPTNQTTIKHRNSESMEKSSKGKGNAKTAIGRLG